MEYTGHIIVLYLIAKLAKPSVASAFFPKKPTKIPPTFEAKLKLNIPNIFLSIIKNKNSI